FLLSFYDDDYFVKKYKIPPSIARINGHSASLRVHLCCPCSKPHTCLIPIGGNIQYHFSFGYPFQDVQTQCSIITGGICYCAEAISSDET
ncbi:MAG: hypothetical protein KBG83_09545, partial [Bacteroidetes bacterium]|nr:hypothetical protein [Bacteroidota bacterium]